MTSDRIPGAHADQAARTSAIVFDLGGVLIDWNPRYLYRDLFRGDEQAMEWFLASVCTPEWNLHQDRGRPFADGIAELVSHFPDHEHLIRAYRDRWHEMIGGPIEETVGVLAELHTDAWPLYALTNWSAETFALARDDFDFLGWFRGIVVSGQERVTKPDERIFRILLERYHLTPAEAIYIDDVRANVETAGQLGMDTILYMDGTDLRAQLTRRGFLDGRPRGAGVSVGPAG